MPDNAAADTLLSIAWKLKDVPLMERFRPCCGVAIVGGRCFAWTFDGSSSVSWTEAKSEEEAREILEWKGAKVIA